jgi:hypothetical protein
MKRLVLLVLGCLAGWFIATAVFGAEPAAGPTASIPADVLPAPNVKQQNSRPAEESFGRPKQDSDEGLKKLLDKEFHVPKPDPFVGFRILLWGITIAGLLVGFTIAALIVVFTLKFIRKTAVPTVTGVPDASFAALQMFDNISQRIENRRKELEAEAAEIDKRMGKASRTTKAK